MEEIKLASSILAAEGLKISAVQNHYSLLYRSSEEAGIIDYCIENNIVFFAYMVLEQGALTDNYNALRPFPNGTRRGEAFNPETLSKLEGLIQIMRNIGNRYNVSTAQVATAWSMAKGTVPIIGVTKLSHIEDVIKAAAIELTVEEIRELETAAKKTNVEVRGSWEKPMR